MTALNKIRTLDWLCGSGPRNTRTGARRSSSPLQLPHLLARFGRQSVAPETLVQVRLPDPVADRLFRRLELPRQRPRTPTRPHKIRSADVPQSGHTDRVLKRLAQPLTEVERIKLVERTTVEASVLPRRF